MNPQRQTPGAPPSHLGFLVETVASNLHLHAMEVVTIAASVSAALRSEDRTLLRACRHILGDNAKALALALKFGAEIGLSPALASRLTAVYAHALEGKRALATMVTASGGGPSQHQLQAQAHWWRRAAGDTAKALEAFDEAARGSLNAVYLEDSRAVRQALQKAANGDEGLIDRSGRLVLPQLQQRRQSPRLAVERAGTLHLPTGAVAVKIADMSRQGLGMDCGQPLAAQQQVMITLDNGTTVEGIVASARGTFYGVSLHTPLSEQDILSSAR